MRDRFVAHLPEWWVRFAPLTRVGLAMLAVGAVLALTGLWYVAGLAALIGLACLVCRAIVRYP